MKIVIDIDEHYYKQLMSDNGRSSKCGLHRAVKEGVVYDHDAAYVDGEMSEHRRMQKCVHNAIDEIRKVAEEEGQLDPRWSAGLRYAVKIIDKNISDADKDILK